MRARDPASTAKPPIRALARTLEVLRVLSRDGAQSLDQLARATGFPRASLARLLDSLAAVGAIARDPASRRWLGLLRLVPAVPAADWRVRLLPELMALCTATGHSVELFAADAGPGGGMRLAMIERADPEDQPVAVRARLGHSPSAEECSAPTQLAHAFGDAAPIRRWRCMTPRGFRPLPMARARRLIAAARARRLGVDLDRNEVGIRRWAIPVQGEGGSLLGVVAVAQLAIGPRADADGERIADALHALDRRLSASGVVGRAAVQRTGGR